MTTHLGSIKVFSKTDNPNPNARIGFIVFYPFQYYVFKNVYENLHNEAEFIIDSGAFFPVRQSPDALNNIVGLLKKRGVYFRILHHDDYFNTKHLEAFFSQYTGLVSLWMRGCLRFECNIPRRKIHLTYGAGKDLITFGLWKSKFDLILAYGARDYQYFSLYSQSRIVGNPKFDDWFNGKFDTTLLTEINTRIDPQKKTVLYLPTHSDLCSIDDLADEIKKLAKNYNVIVKFHYYTPYEEPERVKRMQDPNTVCFNDDADLITLLSVSDVVLSDNSSVIFDAILADKPVIATDFALNKQSVVPGEYKLYRRGLAEELTYFGSIEQKVKKEGKIMALKSCEELPRVIHDALEDPRHYQQSRKELREELFAFRDGKSGERAASAISDLLVKKELPEKPLLWHLVENLGTSERLTVWLEERIRSSETTLIQKQILKVAFIFILRLELFLKRKIIVMTNKT